MQSEIKTPESHPGHPVVGHYFGGYSSASRQTEIYFCDSYDPAIGYWMTNIKNPSDRKNISERAIGRTFYEAYDRGDHYYIEQWARRVEKP